MLVLALACLSVAGLLVRLALKDRAARRCRAALRPHAERYVIERRWLERAARSRAAFERRWRGELDAAYRQYVPARDRRLIGFQDFAWALDAESAAITNPEIASWTFIDRVSHSSTSFERAVARCLERFGWQVEAPAGPHRAPSLLVVRDGARRVGIRCHYGLQEAECRTVPELVAAAERAGCDAAVLVTNGRFLGATRVLARSAGVDLLHCSQLDRIAILARPAARVEIDRIAA